MKTQFSIGYEALRHVVVELERAHFQFATVNHEPGHPLHPPPALTEIVPYRSPTGGHYRNLAFSVIESSTIGQTLPVIVTLGSNYSQLNATGDERFPSTNMQLAQVDNSANNSGIVSNVRLQLGAGS